MIEEIKNEEKVGAKKRGRRKKGERAGYELNMEQTRFFVEFSDDKKRLETLQKSLIKLNDKDFGREINFGDVVKYLIDSLVEKDLPKIQDLSLSHEDKLKLEHKEYEKRTGKKVDFWEFIMRNQKTNK